DGPDAEKRPNIMPQMLASRARKAYDLSRPRAGAAIPLTHDGNCRMSVIGLRASHAYGTVFDLWPVNDRKNAERVAVSQDDMHGYTVAYEREEIQFPVYVVAFIGAVMATIGFAIDNIFLIALSLFAFGFAYYNYPLLETGKPRIGAGQYG